MQEKVDEEMAAAVKKHGVMEIPTTHVEDWYTRVEEERQKIINKAWKTPTWIAL